MYNIKGQELSKNLYDKIKNLSKDGFNKFLGNEELKTNNKTIKGSINEIIDRKENFKNIIINQLKQRQIDISENANWSEIIDIVLKNKKEV